MRKAHPAPRRRPREKKKALPTLDRHQLRAKAETLRLLEPNLSLREIAMKLGQPYVLVRDILDPPPEGEFHGIGLSQYRWPKFNDGVRCENCGGCSGEHELGCANRKLRTG